MMMRMIYGIKSVLTFSECALPFVSILQRRKCTLGPINLLSSAQVRALRSVLAIPSTLYGYDLGISIGTDERRVMNVFDEHTSN